MSCVVCILNSLRRRIGLELQLKKKTLSPKQAASKKVGAELKFGPNRVGLSYRRVKNRRVNKNTFP